MTYLHQARVLMRREPIDVMGRLVAICYNEAGKPFVDAVRSQNFLSPVANVDFYYLKQ